MLFFLRENMIKFINLVFLKVHEISVTWKGGGMNAFKGAVLNQKLLLSFRSPTA